MSTQATTAYETAKVFYLTADAALVAAEVATAVAAKNEEIAASFASPISVDDLGRD